jgi:hypothetical protein
LRRRKGIAAESISEEEAPQRRRKGSVDVGRGMATTAAVGMGQGVTAAVGVGNGISAPLRRAAVWQNLLNYMSHMYLSLF